jgi:D-galactarolactone cycloisomerase
MSGIDIALWDLMGKATGQPVGRLLGGRYRDRVRPYASLLIDDPEPLRDHLAALYAEGFRAFKIGWGKFGRESRRYDENTIIAAREAIGNDALLAVDAGGSEAFFPGSLPWARWAAVMLEAYDVAWFEEPLAPDNLHDLAVLRTAAILPIAGGEVLTRYESFVPFLDARCFDIVQPDATKVGGLSVARRIGWMAQERGVRLIPHGWNTAVGLAADLQLASALPLTDLVEYCTGSVYIDDTTTVPWKLDADGMLAIPDLPGLGIELDLEALERYTDNPRLLTP